MCGTPVNEKELSSFSLEKWFSNLVAQMVKNLPVILETCVWLLGLEDPLEKGMV